MSRMEEDVSAPAPIPIAAPHGITDAVYPERPDPADEAQRLQDEIERRLAEGGGDPVTLAALYTELGLVSLELKDRRQALVALQRAHQHAPELSPPLRASFALFCDAAQWEMAVRILDAELKAPLTDWTRVRLWVLKGDLLRWRLAAPEKAAACYRAALAQDPDHHPAARGLVDALPALDEADEALGWLVESLAEMSDPEAQQARLLEIEGARLRLGRVDGEAVARLRAAAESPHQPGEARRLLAEALWATGGGVEAVAMIRQIAEVEAEPERQAQALIRGAVRAMSVDLGGAVDMLESACALSPAALIGWLALAVARERQADYAAAAEALGELAAFCSSPGIRAGALTYQARLLAGRLDREAEATEALERALSDNAGWAPARWSLARHCRRGGRWAEVARCIKGGLPLMQDPARQAASLCEMASLLGLRGEDVDGAIEACDIALELRPGHPLALALRLLLQARAGDWQGGLQTEAQAPVSADHLRALMRQWLGGDPAVARRRWAALLAAQPDDLLALLHLDPQLGGQVDLEVWAGLVVEAVALLDDPWLRGGLTLRLIDGACGAEAPAAVRALAWRAVQITLAEAPWHADVISGAMALPLDPEAHGQIAEALTAWLEGEGAGHPQQHELWLLLDELRWRLAWSPAPASEPERLGPYSAVVSMRAVWRHLVSGATEETIRALDLLCRALDDAEGQTLGAVVGGLLCLEQLQAPEQAVRWLERASVYDPDSPLVRWLVGQLVREAVDLSVLDAGTLAGADHDTLWRRARQEMARGSHEAALSHLEALESSGSAPCPRAMEQLYRLLGRHRDLEFLFTEWLAGAPSAPILLERALLRACALQAPMGALEDLQHALSLDPELPQAGLWAQALLGQVGDLESVTAQIAALEPDLPPDHPSRLSLMTRRAQLLEEAGSTEQAAAAWEALLAIQGEDLDAVRHLRQLYTQLGRGDEALAMLEREGRLSPDPEEGASLLLAAARVREKRVGDVDGALALLEVALERAPAHDKILEAARQMYGRYGRWAALAQLLEKLSPRVPDARWALILEAARIYVHRLEQPEQAITIMGAILAREDSHDPELLRQLADLYVEQEAWTEAATVYERLREASPDPELRQAVTFRLASLYEEKLNDLERAVACLDALLEVEPDHPEALFRRGQIAEGRGDKALALILFNRAAPRITGPSRIKSLQMRLGALAEESSEYKVALEAYARALQMTPDDLEIAERIARFVQAPGLVERVFDLLEDAEQASPPESAESWGALKRRLIRTALKVPGAEDRGVRAARRLAGETPDDDRARLLYAEALTARDETADQAAVQYRAVLERDPFHVEALRGLRRLSERTGHMARAYQISLLLNGMQCGGEAEQAIISRHHPQVRRSPGGRLSGMSEPALLDNEEQPSINLLLIELSECLPDLLPPHDFELYAEPMMEGPLAELGHQTAKAFGGRLEIKAIPGAMGQRVYYTDGRPTVVTFPEGALTSIGRGERLFHMGRALHLGHRGLAAWTRLSTEEARKALAVALAVDGDWTPFPADHGPLAERAEALRATLDESARRRLREAAEQLRALGGDPPLGAALSAVRRSADRVGLLIAGSMLPAISVLTREAGVRRPGRSGPTLEILRGIPRLRALAWWSLSDSYFALRGRLGLDTPT